MAYSIGEGTTIRKLLGGTVKYNIPRYQRNYVWTDKHWEDLWEDLLFVLNNKSSNIQHFFSTFIFEKNGNINGIDNFNVIDGQQRLSTILVILSAVCRKLIEINNKTQHSLIIQYLTATDTNGKYIKISNNNSDLLGEIISSILDFKDNSSFIDLNISDFHGVPRDKKNILICYNYFLNKLTDYLSNSSVETQSAMLNNFTNAILDMQIVQILVDKEQEGYDIFEILNARGTPLAQHELLKNYIFKYYKPIGDIDNAKRIWNEIDNLLILKNHNYLANFIDHYTIHKYGKPDKINTVLRIIKNHNKKNNTKELLEDIYAKSKYYKWLISPQEILDNDLIDSKQITENIFSILVFFSLKKQTQFRPLLISLFSLVNNYKKKYDKAKFESPDNNNLINQYKNDYFSILNEINDAISYLLNFSLVEFVIKKQQPKIFEQKIHDLAQKIEKGIEIPRNIRNVMPITITKDLFISSFCLLGYSNKIPEYDRNNTKHDIRQILRMYELYLQKTDELTIDNMTIEHILNDSKNDLNSCYIGNLLPMSEEIQKEIKEEKTLEKKLIYYKKSQFATVKEFVRNFSSHKVWTPKKIKNRSIAIAEVFYYKIFKLG